MNAKSVILVACLVGLYATPAEATHTDRCTDSQTGEPYVGCVDIVPENHIGGASLGSMGFSFKGVLSDVPAGCSRQPAKWYLSGPNNYSAEATGDSATLPFSAGGKYYIRVDVPFQCACTTTPGFFCRPPNPDVTPCSEYAPTGCAGNIGQSYGGYGIEYDVYEPPIVTGVVFGENIVDKPTFITPQTQFPHSPTEADWFWGDGKQCLNCSYQEGHIYELPGEYDATVVWRNPAGVLEQKYKVQIQPDPPTVIWGLGENPDLTAGVSVKFTSTIGGGEPDRQILWDFGDGTTSTEEDPTHTFAANDDYVVSLAVTNRWGTTTESKPMYIDPRSGGSPPSAANFRFDPAAPVVGQQVRFFDESTGSIARWRWNFDFTSPLQDLTTADLSYQQNPVHSYDAWGRKNVELWVSNAFGRKGIVLFVDVLRADQPPLANFTWTPQVPYVNQVVQFTDTSAGATAWEWDFGDGATSTAQHPTHAFTNAGQQKVTLKVSNQFGSDTVTKFFACELPGGDALIADFSFAPVDPRPGDEVAFTDQSSGSPETWSWTFSDGFTSNVRNPRHSFATADSYTVTLRIGKGNETHQTSKTVVVANNAKPSANFSWSPATPRVNQVVSFSDRSTGSPTSFSWDFGDGASSSARTPTHTYAGARTYSVRLSVSNDAGSDTTTRIVEVVEEEKEPKASFTWSPSPGNAGSPVVFNDTSTGPPASWSWSFGDGSGSSAQNPSHVYAVDGTYSATLTVSNSKGSDSVTNSVSIGNTAKPKANFTWSPTNPQAGEAVSFTDASTNGPASWQWSFGDGGSASGKNVTHTYAQAGTYTTTLTVSNDAGSDTKSSSITAGAASLAADFFASTVDAVINKPVEFADRSTGNPDAWLWDFGDGHTSTVRNPTHTYVREGIPRVTLEVRKGEETKSASQPLTVFAPPRAQFGIDGKLAVGIPIRFIDRSKGPARGRKWFVGGAELSREATFEHTPESMGETQVRLEIENPAGRDALSRGIFIGPRPGDERPVIERVEGKGRCFFKTLTTAVHIDPAIDWKSHSANVVWLEVNGGEPKVFDVSGVLFPDSIDFSSDELSYRGSITENFATVQAIATPTARSDKQELKFFGYVLPPYLADRPAKRTIVEPNRVGWAFGVYVPPGAFEEKIPLPVEFPIFGGLTMEFTKTQFKLERVLRTDCSAYSYIEAAGGFKFGNKLFAGLKGTAASNSRLSQLYGIDQDPSSSYAVAVEGFFGKTVIEKSLLEAIPIMRVPCQLPVIKQLCGTTKAKLEIVGSVGGNVDFGIKDDGYPDFKKFLFTAKLQITASAGPKVAWNKLEVFGGGKAGVAFGPWTHTPFLQKGEIGIELGGRVIYLIFTQEYKEGFACAYDSNTNYKWVCGAAVKTARSPEVQSDTSSGLRILTSVARTEPVEEPRTGDPVVLRNVSTMANPSADARGDRAIVVYVSEKESMGDSAQRTEIRSVIGNGTPLQWQESKGITDDGNGDFSPSVVWTSDGGAVAAWERIGNPELTFSEIADLEDLPVLAQEMEIATATYDAAAGSWSAVTTLTTNRLRDSSPVLAALDDGGVILAWLRQAPDGTAPPQIVTRTRQNGTWSEERVLTPDLWVVDRLALAARGTKAVLVAGYDRDGDFATATDRDLVSFEYRDGAWSARRDVTSDADDDSTPTVAYEGDVARLYWNRNGRFATRMLPEGAIELVREDDRADPSATVVTMKSDGTAILVWPSGSSVYGQLRDPSSKQWSAAAPLASRAGVPSSLHAFLSPDGRLHLVGAETELIYKDEQRFVDGNPVTIERVSSPGRVDVVDYVTSLHVDLAAATLTPDTPVPAAGELVPFVATVSNLGHLPVRDIPIELRRGTEVVATSTVGGEWQPGESKEITLTASYDPASRHFTLIVDPASTSSDAQPANNSLTYAFGNIAPYACLQANVARGANPLQISLDATCSSDSDGTIVSRRWMFGDGEAAEGMKVLHTYATAGTYTATLIVTDDTGGVSTASIELGAGTGEDWRPARKTHSLYVPIVGRAAGVGGSFFVTDISIMNSDAVEPLEIDAVYIPDGKREFHRRITLQGGEVQQSSDLLARVFGAADGTGSLRLDVSHPHALAVARTYNRQPSGTAGFSSNAVRREDALHDGETGVVLQHWLPGYRTNVGLTEIGGNESEITATAFDDNGTVIGSEVFRLGPYQHVQGNGLRLFQNRGRIELTVRGGVILPYVATLDGQTSDPIYQTAEARPSATTGSSLLIPIVGRLRGINDSTWRSDVRVFNASSSALTVSVALRTAAGTHNASFELQAGQTASFDDVVAALFPQLTGDVSGALAISAAGPLMVTSRTFNLTAKGTYGLYIPGRGESELLAAGETAYLLQVQENTAYRCNFGMAAFDTPGRVSVRALDANGRTLATKEYAVAAGQNVQIGRVAADMGVADPSAVVALEVTASEGKLFVYASIVDNGTGDSTFVEAGR